MKWREVEQAWREPEYDPDDEIEARADDIDPEQILEDRAVEAELNFREPWDYQYDTDKAWSI